MEPLLHDLPIEQLAVRALRVPTNRPEADGTRRRRHGRWVWRVRRGAEVIDFSREDPVAVVRDPTGGIGADRRIDAIGVGVARPAWRSPTAPEGSAQTPSQAAAERDAVAGDKRIRTGGTGSRRMCPGRRWTGRWQ